MVNMKTDVFIVFSLIVLGLCEASTYDCSTAYNEREITIDITETDSVDTVLATFNNSFGDLRWTASINGTGTNYLSLFFKSSLLEGVDHTHALKVAKKLDLELLQLELVSAAELFTEPNDNFVTLDLSVLCGQNTGRANEMVFKLNIRSVNEFYPQFLGSPFKATVAESSAIGADIFNIGAKATDLDAGKTSLSFAIAPYMITQFDGSRYVVMDKNENGVIVLSRNVDFEAFLRAGRTYMFVNVTATDEGGFTSATSINVSITDSNDQGVHLVYPGCDRPCLQANYSSLTNESFVGPLDVRPVAVHAEDLDTLNDSIVYTLVSDSDREFFDIDEATGRLYKISPFVNDSYGFSIPVEVHARESTDESHFLDFNVTILIAERMPNAGSSNPTVSPLHERSDIECNPDTVAIFLPDTLFPEQRNITWREDFCSVYHNGTHYVSNILLSECGTTVLIENNTVTFSNELIVHKVADDNDVTSDADERSVTYGEDYETVIPVKCIYPRFNNVSTKYTPVKQNVRFFEKRFGNLDVAMEQFESETFEKSIDTSDYPRKIPLDDDVFVRVGLNFEPNNLRVKTEQCIATSAPSPADTNWRPLIQSGCPKDRVRLLSTDESSDVRFAFKAFDFRHNSSGLVYIHCEVSVCETAEESCIMGCASRAKRSASSRQKSQLVSTGPLFVERREQTSKEMVAMPTVVAAVCLVVAMASVILAIVGWTRKSRHDQAI